MVNRFVYPELADNNRECQVEEKFVCVRLDELDNLLELSVEGGESAWINVIDEVVLFFLVLKATSYLLEHNFIHHQLIINPEQNRFVLLWSIFDHILGNELLSYV